MMNIQFAIGGRMVSLAALLVAFAIVQWLIFAAISLISRAKVPKKGLRDSDRNLVFSSAVFLVLWAAPFVNVTHSPKVAAASMTGKTHGSCSSVDVGMTAAEVKSRLGEPDETRSDEETRGPSASKWIYRDSRCVVHVFEEKVEFID